MLATLTRKDGIRASPSKFTPVIGKLTKIRYFKYENAIR